MSLPHEAEGLALSLKMWMTIVYQHPEVIVTLFWWGGIEMSQGVLVEGMMPEPKDNLDYNSIVRMRQQTAVVNDRIIATGSCCRA